MLNASARKARQKTPPNRWPVRSALVVFFTAAALVAAMCALSFFAQPQQTAVSEVQSATVSSITRSDIPTTVIISLPNRNDCRRYHLDSATGAINDDATSNCT